MHTPLADLYSAIAMPFNPLLLPTVALTLALFIAGLWLARIRASKLWRVGFGVAALAAAVPALLFSAYYTHLFDHATWFYVFRALPFTELLAAGIGFSAGWSVGLVNQRTGLFGSRTVQRVLSVALIVGSTLIMALPYAKPVVAPLRGTLHDEWRDGVCMQSTLATCGPASAVTILRQFGVVSSERELAAECFSYARGTENWYIARAFQKRGLNAKYVISGSQPKDIPFPSITGVGLGPRGRGGHFVAILDQQDEKYVVGDPLVGKLLLTRAELQARYFLTGFFLVIQRP